MATQWFAEVNQQLWDESLARLQNISRAMFKQNVELEARIARLEVELRMWKQAHSVALEASERDTNAHNVQIAALKKQICAIDSVKENGSPLILCIINGNNMFFTQSLLVQGFVGGMAAAHRLTKAIAGYLAHEEIQISGRLSFWASLYFNRRELFDSLVGHKICSQEQLDDFLAGFSQASPRFVLIDVGLGNEAVDVKIQEYIETYVRFPQTSRVVFGGCVEARYSGTFHNLNSDDLLYKLVALRNTTETVAAELLPYAIPGLELDDLFMSQFLTSSKVHSLNAYESTVGNGGLASPQSPVIRASKRLIDPSLPLHKQSPPPCNEYYLMTCSKGAGACKYSHDYILTPDQLASLATSAKKAPCNWLKNGLQCPIRDKCCWGHTCPNGLQCHHLSKGKCWFKGKDMHEGFTGTP